jgi:2-polyprenyl-3-methyl-5-hydroxy-6-metoxy-1,4-benzoquinol methylase
MLKVGGRKLEAGTWKLNEGSYARKQIFCRSRLVAWSHGSRFELAQKLVSNRGGRLLDYGCGDGTFVAMVHDRFAEATGVDVDAGQIDECVRRLGSLPNARFGLTTELADGANDGRWDVITCMEVLEHCLEEERRRILDQLRRLVANSGIVLISVPIEVGPSLIGKHAVRAIAGLRRLGDYQYRERYTWVELLRSLIGAEISRPVYEGVGPRGPYRYHGHKGFDFRALEREIRARFHVERRLFSPLAPLGALLNSQVWFECRKQLTGDQEIRRKTGD